MSCSCCAGGLHVNAYRYDPTRTATLRAQFEAEIVRRFKRVRQLIIEEVSKQDGFGLKANAGRFEFSRSNEKVEAFMRWLRQMEKQEILGIQRGAPVESAAQTSWMNVYISSAYQKGLARSASQLKAAGATVADTWLDAAFRRPIHADRVGLIYTRVFSDLQGITEAMDRQISRVLAQGLVDGLNPKTIASQLANRVDAIGLNRARTLARTEVISAHAEATLNGFTEAGIEGVEVEAEFSTTGDGKVCPQCEALEGKTVPISQARGMLPVHPNCRCAWIPKVVGGTGIELR